jgi:hypothetical protein
LVAAFVLLFVAPHAPAVQRTQFDHLTTGYELRGAHRDLSCEFCHMKGVFKGTARTCEGCHTTGSRISSTPRPPNHITTQGNCALCHAEYNFLPIFRMDHSATLGTCFSCHNGIVAEGKHPDHIPSDNNCDACHTTNAFNPQRVDHVNLVARASACRGCHTGVRAASLPRNHIPTSAECSSCHSTLSWSPARFDHSGIAGTCQGCHNGATAIGKVAGHMATSRDCSTCHRFPNWMTVTFTHTAAEYPGEHRGAPGCTACHTTNTDQATWKFAAFKPGCGGCHAAQFKPDGHQKTAGLLYSVGELQNCSGACHVYTDIKMTTIAKARPAGHHKVTDGAFH